jgi:hypothetical protein
MSYTRDFALNLGSGNSGLTDLRAQAAGSTGASAGSTEDIA